MSEEQKEVVPDAPWLVLQKKVFNKNIKKQKDL